MLSILKKEMDSEFDDFKVVVNKTALLHMFNSAIVNSRIRETYSLFTASSEMQHMQPHSELINL